MQTTKTLLLVATFGTILAAGQAQTIVNRYTFSGNLTDSVGTYDGTGTGSGTNIEPITFGSLTPSGVVGGGPTQSAIFGVNYGTKKSHFIINNNVFNDIAAAGSLSFFTKIDGSTTGGAGFLLATTGNNVALTSAATTTRLTATGNNTAIGTTAISVDMTSWKHVALTWQKVSTDLVFNYYVNGSLVASKTNANSSISVSALRIGGFSANFADDISGMNNQFRGSLYDMQFYSGALDATDVAYLAANPGAIAAIPEPSSIALLTGLGSITLGATRRRRRL